MVTRLPEIQTTLWRHTGMKGIQEVKTKYQRRAWYVQAYGRTPKGQRFLLAEIELAAKKMSDPDFKSQQAAAVAQLYA